MNLFEKFLYFLQGTMEEPMAFGWFHWMWIGLTILSIFILFKLRDRYSEKQLKWVLGIYGIIALSNRKRYAIMLSKALECHLQLIFGFC